MNPVSMVRRNFFLPPRIWDALQNRAIVEQTTISAVIRGLLVKSLGLDANNG